MLNRRLSDYIFFGSLALIALVIVLIRLAVVGAQTERIEQLDRDNIRIQREIDQLNTLVQENKDIQTGHLYELYDIIPNDFSAQLLEFKTIAMLEQLGIDESNEFERAVTVDTDVSLGSSDLAAVTAGYYVVRVDVTFITDDITYVIDFLDMLQESEQLFLLDSVEYTETRGAFFQEMQISFYAIYDIDTTTES
jgi:hypothetical protein